MSLEGQYAIENDKALAKVILQRGIGAVEQLTKFIDENNWDMAAVAAADISVFAEMVVHMVLHMYPPGGTLTGKLHMTEEGRQVAHDLNQKYQSILDQAGYAWPDPATVTPHNDAPCPLAGILKAVTDTHGS